MSEAIRAAGSAPARQDALAAAFVAVLACFLAVGYFRRPLYDVSPALYWAFDVLKFVAAPAAALLFLARYGIRPRDYGLQAPPPGGRLEFAGLTAFMALILVLAYYTTLHLAWILVRAEPATFYKDIGPSGALRVPMSLYLAVSAGFTEEVFFRALPLLYLERRMAGRAMAPCFVLGTACLCAALHWAGGLLEVAAAFAYGVAAAAVYYRLRDLWPLVAAHATVDLIELAAYQSVGL